jgi:hypothetical protein
MIPLTEVYFSEGVLIGKYTLTGTMISAISALLSYRLSMLKSVYTKRVFILGHHRSSRDIPPEILILSIASNSSRTGALSAIVTRL